MVHKARWPILLVFVVALVAVLSACGQKAAEVKAVKVDNLHIGTHVLLHPGKEMKVDNTHIGTHVLLHPGELFGVTLKGATWTFNPVSDPSVLAEVPSQAGTSHPTVNCAPELGCGVTDAWYRALAPGTAIVSATQVSCIGKPTCVADQGVYRLTVVVVT
jgi:hypothetical protein